MARMKLMKEISSATKVIGDMAKGATVFDADKARAAADALARHATEIAAAFEAPADDPKSEALPAIREDFSGFTQIAHAMAVAARLDTGELSTEADLRPVLDRIGKTRTDCHEIYRE